MVTHCSILAWKIPQTEEPWQATVHEVCKESETTEWAHTYMPKCPLIYARIHMNTYIYMTLFWIQVFLNSVSGTVPSILFYAFFQWAVFLSSVHTAVCKSSLLFLTLQSIPSRPLAQYLWCELLCVHCGHVGNARLSCVSTRWSVCSTRAGNVFSPQQYPQQLEQCQANSANILRTHFSRVQLFNAMDCSTPGSSVHGILQARILETGWHFFL